jgi:hypothetical protein
LHLHQIHPTTIWIGEERRAKTSLENFAAAQPVETGQVGSSTVH